MTIEIRWIASPAASCLHAAGALVAGRSLVDLKTAAAIEPETRLLSRELAAWEIDRREFFARAIPTRTRRDTPTELAEAVVAALVGPDALADITHGLARRLAALEVAYNKANPRAIEKLELRAAPLREQWEARGPGLVKAIERATNQPLFVRQADVILLQPVLGGGGAVYAKDGAVSIEAVLTNPIAELPEVVRLGWQLAQLNPRLYNASESDDDQPAMRLIPPVLAAAQEVELARLSVDTIGMAITAWTGGWGHEAKAAALWKWWNAVQPDEES